jgi:hypothetical protein
VLYSNNNVKCKPLYYSIYILFLFILFFFVRESNTQTQSVKCAQIFVQRIHHSIH